MKECIGVYLHGFLSSGQSEKGQWLTQKNTQDSFLGKSPLFTKFITVTYPIKSVHESLKVIESILAKYKDRLDKIVMLGSSMGGFYAQYLGQKYQLPYIMINPALNPVPVFSENIGLHTNPSTGEVVLIDNAYIADIQSYDVKTLDKNIPALLLIDTDDEVIDVDFAIQHYQDSAAVKRVNSRFEVVIYSGGDHRFIHMEDAWLKIKQFIENL
ncbi:YqiA/YcfP family alpha/beta fold hydrolase [Thiomicrorhabdus sp. Kp2]|uniref:YqiA/YcfP family alpha/beta fold hydrolase n=1 Tax=Thiomicrorhabdus sp. Kp2 TaxID=1123518 RepID=UPI0004020247|nr:YqiA/YcfP family alpha/beta fold hydrolase [Thiomicrorhabdus sp. Kp2]